MSPRYLTTSELAELCRTSPSTVRYWRLLGRGPRGFKVGRHVLYDERDVAAWLDALRSDPTEGSTK